MTSAAGTTRLTRPHRAASAAVKRLPVSRYSTAMARGSRAGSRSRPPQQAAGVGDDAERHLGERELGVLGGDHQVRSQDQLEAPAEGEPVDRGDDRLADVEELGQP